MPHNSSDEDFADNIAFILRRAQEASFAAYASIVDQRGLRPGHYVVLRIIHDQLSRQVGRDKTTITPILQEFEKKEMIRRDIDPVDRRGRLLSLLPAGEKYLSELRACASAHNASLNQIVGPDRQALLDTLMRIIIGLDRHAKLPPKK
jgi:DNA-binding MarR family transcriptional regulator